MRNAQVIEKFIAGEIKADASNLYIEDRATKTVLFNYSTAIAERSKATGEFIVNRTRYSGSTSAIQGELGKQLTDAGKVITLHLFKVKKNTNNLS